MNYLAHLFLSRHQQKYVLGNYLADMMTLKEIRSWSLEAKRGVDLHRFIDAFTDAHPSNREMKRKLRPHFRKYAGVALDIYYDFILYRFWDLYSDVEFDSFCSMQYKWLIKDESLIPGRLRPTVYKMIKGDFLRKYTSIEGQRFAFQQMEQRATFYTGFEFATDLLIEKEEELSGHFQSFFPDIIAETNKYVLL